MTDAESMSTSHGQTRINKLEKVIIEVFLLSVHYQAIINPGFSD